MPKLHADFIQQPWYKNYSIVLIIIGILGTIYTLYDRASTLAEIERQQMMIDQYQSVLPSVSVQPPSSDSSSEENLLNKEIILVSKELTSPWGIILDDLQIALNRKVKLTQINIELNKPVKVIGNTEDSRFLHDFIQQLASNPSWQSIEIISEITKISEVQVQSDIEMNSENNHDIQFELKLMRAD